MLKFSGSYKGSWLFKAAPIQQKSSAYSGALKAFLVKLYMPVFLVLSIVFTWIFTVRILPDLFAVLLAGIVQTLITYKLVNDEEYPFSKSFEFAQEAGAAKMMLLSLVTGVFVIGHLIANIFDFGIYIYIVLLYVVILLGWRRIFPPNRVTKSSLVNGS